MTDVTRLTIERTNVETALEAVRKRVRLAQDRDRKRRRRETCATACGSLNQREQCMVLRTLSLVDWACADAVVLLDKLRIPPRWQARPVASRVALVEAIFLTCDLELAATWTDIAMPENLAAMTELWVLFSEWKTALWVAEMNTEKGTAPSSSLVHQRFVHTLHEAPSVVQEQVWIARTRFAKRCWAYRWRRRWDTAIGTLKVGDVDPPHVLRSKAGPDSSTEETTRHPRVFVASEGVPDPPSLSPLLAPFWVATDGVAE